MRRTRWIRITGAFLAGWFTLVASEHAPLNPCPMHGDLTVTAPAPTSPIGDSHSHSATTPAETGHEDHTGGKCSCTGDCASQQISTPEVRPPEALFLPAIIAGPVGVSEVAGLPTSPAFLRPFANGPPLLRIG